MTDTISTHFDDFNQIVSMIQAARLRAYAKVNEELINLYYNVGKFVSQKVENAEWGAGVVDKLAQFIKENHPEIKGFTRRGLYRMKQFYEAYKDSEIVSAVRTQLSWTHHRLILAKTKTIEEKEFYIKLFSHLKFLQSHYPHLHRLDLVLLHLSLLYQLPQ